MEDTQVDDRRDLGRDGEALARRYIERHGMTVLDANWRCREGEIDLVAKEGDTLVIIEVKTRRTLRFGRAVEAVTYEKYQRLRRLAALWLSQADVFACRVRVDVIGIEWLGDMARIDHRRGVVL